MEFVPSPFHKIITCCGRTKLKGKIVHFIKAKKLWVSARDGCM